jgi:hypothetical protein
MFQCQETHISQFNNISPSIKRRLQWLIFSRYKNQNISNTKIIKLKTWHYFIETVMRYNNQTFKTLILPLSKSVSKLECALLWVHNSKHHESLQ